MTTEFQDETSTKARLEESRNRKVSKRVQRETFFYSKIVPVLLLLLALGLVVILLVVTLSVLGVIPPR